MKEGIGHLSGFLPYIVKVSYKLEFIMNNVYILQRKKGPTPAMADS